MKTRLFELPENLYRLARYRSLVLGLSLPEYLKDLVVTEMHAASLQEYAACAAQPPARPLNEPELLR